MAYKIVVANQKGGVAKTTTAINIADALMYMGFRVLFVDLDPQCNSSTVFTGGKYAEADYTLYDVFRKKKSFRDCIITTDFGDIVCGSVELADEEDRFMRAPGGLKVIKYAIEEIEDDYDYVVMDTPPNCGAYMRNALFAADGIVIPVQAKKFALDGLARFLDTVNLLKRDDNEKLEILGILMTLYDVRNAQDKEVLEALPEICNGIGVRLFKNVIRTCQDIEKCISASVSLFKTKKTSNGANDYAALVVEMMDIIKK